MCILRVGDEVICNKEAFRVDSCGLAKDGSGKKYFKTTEKIMKFHEGKYCIDFNDRIGYSWYSADQLLLVDDSDINTPDLTNFTFPRHYMTDRAIIGQKKPCGVLVFGRKGMKCHTIYGDILMQDLRFPTKDELNSIDKRSCGHALTEIDRVALTKKG